MNCQIYLTIRKIQRTKKNEVLIFSVRCCYVSEVKTVIVDENIVAYINALDTNIPEYLLDMAKEALENHVPIIRRETMTLLKFLIQLKQPKNILEIGAAVGFSSILMSEYMPKNCHITTIERNEQRIQKAKENIVKYKKSDEITLLEGDAADILKDLVNRNNSHIDKQLRKVDNKISKNGQFDFIFMDAAKGQYMNFFPYIMELISSDGMLLTDNVLQEGKVAKSRYGITRRDRTIHARMREYLYTLTHMDDLNTIVLPVGDGVTISTFVNNK